MTDMEELEALGMRQNVIRVALTFQQWRKVGTCCHS